MTRCTIPREIKKKQKRRPRAVSSRTHTVNMEDGKNQINKNVYKIIVIVDWILLCRYIERGRIVIRPPQKQVHNKSDTLDIVWHRQSLTASPLHSGVMHWPCQICDELLLLTLSLVWRVWRLKICHRYESNLPPSALHYSYFHTPHEAEFRIFRLSNRPQQIRV